MNSVTLLVIALCCLALGYRYYSAFLAAKVAVLDDRRLTPAHKREDGRDFVPTNRLVLFGHHFAAIAGAGPLLGPVLAAQFGFAPGAIWIVVGAVFAGAVHDFVVLWGSVRGGGASLAKVARDENGAFAGGVASVAIFFIIILSLSVLAMAVVNSLKESAWGTSTIALTIPIALFVGLYLHVFRPGNVAEASVIGAVLVLVSVGLGKAIASSALASWFTFDQHHLTVLIAGYGFVASVLPVWLLLCPRDYLSSYLKIGVIGLLVVGVFWVHPQLVFPAVTKYVAGGGPIIPGAVWPFVCITIACGAISGFHSLIGSGTTPKMVNRESDIRFIGYGAMIVEAAVAVIALIAACSLQPGDYYAINCTVAKYATLGMQHVDLDTLTAQVGEQSLVGRTGGAVTLAVGMARIFSGIGGLSRLMAFWYHFAIVFEALFILTVVDTGTRVARFILQDFAARIHPRFRDGRWAAGVAITSGLTCLLWGYMVYTGDITRVWPMFGIANQLLASIALAIGTTLILRRREHKYALVTFIPFCFMLVTTLTAGALAVTRQYLPGGQFNDYLNAGLTLAMMALALLIAGDSARRWLHILATGECCQDRLELEFTETDALDSDEAKAAVEGFSASAG